MSHRVVGWILIRYQQNEEYILCSDCPSNSALYRPLTQDEVANKEDQCANCKRVYRDGKWLENIQKKGKAKNGDEIWLSIDPGSDPYCVVTLWTLGDAIGLNLETPEQATALYEALLNVTDIEAD